jgi:hypothetical protein
MQTTSHILMIRPVSFVYNEETAINNAFQSGSRAKQTAKVQETASPRV